MMEPDGQSELPIRLVDVDEAIIDIDRDLSVSFRQRKPGPPERIDGLSMGIVTIDGDGPHGGERHPDGDEILYIISGELILHADRLDEPLRIAEGQACIVRKGEWHKVSAEKATRIVHVTPGPRGDARPL
ncbi:cupin domain-containing protein [Parasphingorhabdus sp.]|uniref:cupin domain-containing protein n=1 Tax=Parasphingorhabdus sp. TaxID=2709688 RepID=UPI003264996C